MQVGAKAGLRLWVHETQFTLPNFWQPGSHDFTDQDELLDERKSSFHLSMNLLSPHPCLFLFHPSCILMDFSFSPSIVSFCIIDLSLFPWPPNHHTIRLSCLLALKPKQEPSLDCRPLPATISFLCCPFASQLPRRIDSIYCRTIFISHLLISLFWSLLGRSLSPHDHPLPGHFLHQCISFIDLTLANLPISALADLVSW